ncbi:hypothetical protein A6V36_34425 [Paraburkholderia ginsengiterrae]|uniref:Uncharacterized protein n=1 Tax=Paraburkholderia ginsengiterrae TaxID=1462993 RepID=A0A1A9N1E1_9BURK|nr:Imm52 family immunity protein [Paraburkholderia ginsengiterrae]OAJ55262.1 hypothetical protein A6V37_33370 [Paraburkholderia ginsengiterrae]OAJ55642.1 hypothetical protein A6V36_34425 [Paraburkholderia ginsengiterrae]
MNTRFHFIIKRHPLTEDEGYEWLSSLLTTIHPFLPTVHWYLSPSTQEESKRPFPQVVDRTNFLAWIKRRHAETLREWPEYPFGFSALLTSASDERAFEVEEGRCSLIFEPGHGRIQLEIIDPDIAWPQSDVTKMMKGILGAVVNDESVEFAAVDTSKWPRKDGEKGADTYSIDFRTFPHRRFLGWMGFVPKVIEPADLTQADEVIPILSRRGSIVVAVSDQFDVHNPLHIEQAQRVEMRLVDLDALPVIDPSFQ